MSFPYVISCMHANLEEVNDWLKEMLENGRLKFVPAGNVLEGRRYEEDVYVFEE